MFFRVKQPIKIGGKVFQTCVCYSLSPVIKETVEGLVKEGKAEIFDEEVFFANGKIVSKNDVEKERKKDDKEPSVKENLVKGSKDVKDF